MKKILLCCLIAICISYNNVLAQADDLGNAQADDLGNAQDDDLGKDRTKFILTYYQGVPFEAGGKFNGKPSSGFGIGVASKRERTYAQLEMKIKDSFNARDTLDSLHKSNMSSLKLFTGFSLSNKRSGLFHGSGIGVLTAVGFTQKGNTAFEKNPFMSGLYLQINLNWPQTINISIGARNGPKEKFDVGLFIRPAYTLILNSIDDGVQSPQFMGTLDYGLRILIN